jgi:hypothetical protein
VNFVSLFSPTAAGMSCATNVIPPQDTPMYPEVKKFKILKSSKPIPDVQIRCLQRHRLVVKLIHNAIKL